jgi:hypothetical protein
MFLSNLNVFLAASMVLTLVAGSLVALVLVFPLSLLSRALTIDTSWVIAMSYLSIPLTLGIVWWRRGLVPVGCAPGRELRYRRGQQLLFMANVSIVTTVVLPMVLALAGGKAEYTLFGLFLTPFIGLGAVAGLFGLFMVWTSGDRL